MIALSPGGRVYLACGVTDMRKGAVGLAMLVQQSLAENPFDGRGVCLPWPSIRTDQVDLA